MPNQNATPRCTCGNVLCADTSDAHFLRNLVTDCPVGMNPGDRVRDIADSLEGTVISEAERIRQRVAELQAEMRALVVLLHAAERASAPISDTRAWNEAPPRWLGKRG